MVYKKNTKQLNYSLILTILLKLTEAIQSLHYPIPKIIFILCESTKMLINIEIFDLPKKTTLTEADIKELAERNELLLREMERFNRMTRNVQRLVGAEVAVFKKPKEDLSPPEYIPSCYGKNHVLY
ncbi:unnamed protein product [Diatraea saccharalis]|uniref:Uncharacterized protein n=1 Tax=Diatraea saccharalis TaxID=40085 RepID=A0A9N9R498_9NEOP|nr:unnamed protein product [Diatraea saccharalis]